MALANLQQNVPDKIRACLQILEPSFLEIIDQSALHAGHEGAKAGGGHYIVTIVSAKFSGLRTIERQRMAYAALGTMLQREIHALSMRTLTPEEM